MLACVKYARFGVLFTVLRALVRLGFSGHVVSTSGLAFGLRTRCCRWQPLSASTTWNDSSSPAGVYLSPWRRRASWKSVFEFSRSGCAGQAVDGTYDVMNSSFAVLQIPTNAHQESHDSGAQWCPSSHVDPDLTRVGGSSSWRVGLARQIVLVFLVFGMRADFFCLFCRQSPFSRERARLKRVLCSCCRTRNRSSDNGRPCY